MNRIDEIKERTKKGISEYMHDADRAEIHQQDALYLLDLNVRYKEALERVQKNARSSLDAKYPSYGNTLELIEKVTLKALEE